MSNHNISLTECIRDAIQGVKELIPAEKKAAYINDLIHSGLFDVIDFGSFVAPKAVPQMADTAQVLEAIEKNERTKLLAIIANEKGAEMGLQHEKIDYLGYPFSISETFQKRNTNATVLESLDRVKAILDLLSKTNQQQLVVYISMAFGNPYGDPWHMELVSEWVDKLVRLGIRKISIADTTAEADPNSIKEIFKAVKQEFSNLELSLHLHSNKESTLSKVNAAYDAGCRIFESAILGYGGCPFAKDTLVGNVATEVLIDRFCPLDSKKIEPLISKFKNLITIKCV